MTLGAYPLHPVSQAEECLLLLTEILVCTGEKDNLLFFLSHWTSFSTAETQAWRVEERFSLSSLSILVGVSFLTTAWSKRKKKEKKKRVKQTKIFRKEYTLQNHLPYITLFNRTIKELPLSFFYRRLWSVQTLSCQATVAVTIHSGLLFRGWRN